MKSFLKYTLATIVGVMIAGIIMAILSIGIVSSLVSMGENTVSVKDKTVLIIRLENEIIERANNSPFSDLDLPGFAATKQTGLDDILSCIEKAKTDDNIEGIYLNPSTITAGLATVEEVRDALIDFKESGKFIYAYGETFSQKAYYLASAADQVVLNPKGVLELKGLSAHRMFYKNALEKIGIEMQVIRHGKFKAAVEPYLLEKMSPENRLQTEKYTGSLWRQMLMDISESRGISIEKLNELADGVTTFRGAEYLLNEGLVDTLKYKDQVIDDLKQLTATRESKDVRSIEIKAYSKVPAPTDGKGLARDKIAVIYATGGIDMPGSGTDGIDSEKLSRTIRQARRDSSIKAIVLRINSPGGSAYGSEVIWREVKLAAETKPVIASMGDVAASGGYYIAAAADTILADHTTITGSIGIFGVIPNINELMIDKLGITQDVVNTNAHSDILSLTRPLTEFEKGLMQNYIEKGYDIFTGRVAEGRDMTTQAVDEVGQGRVWAATDAIEIGLIDQYGGVNDAIDLAKEMAGLDRYRIKALPELKDPFEEWIKEMSGSARMWVLKQEIGEAYPIYQRLKEIKHTRGVMAKMPYDVRVD
ncbi:signal peptide peptidase SppA [uncultured Sunxiuqinia sp.]|uniref:signal peptide peptidase SppA n=1 Tax=uncultured Sunxiuqinia sp. TaxID=1573825 RepID=UPI002AA742D9|nr:signal peptide peptidase SppA [uncultured Sunxiuqinia sp.]